MLSSNKEKVMVTSVPETCKDEKLYFPSTESVAGTASSTGFSKIFLAQRAIGAKSNWKTGIEHQRLLRAT